MKQGIFFALFAAFLWGLAPILEKIGLAKLSPLAGLTVRSIGITLVILILNFFKPTWKELGEVDFKSIIFILLGGLIAGLIAQWIYYRALKYIEASRVAPIVGSYPFFAFILGILILGEKVTWNKILGSIFILIGILLLK
ncbi:hypothetical protein BBF96_00045 [Anoxybacter fermentans]|uniref:EamA domain-containing protein n=1 Tax=Anoxybacter fermentans TaxID=1323375 RepID=A0A3Q9HN99_9FIRM|nr:EamA family transporter [Anoxybacter fermentans]AZR71935.1 hypothetical protein BBF96_00045 [Anoxybacter fermentans]